MVNNNEDKNGGLKLKAKLCILSEHMIGTYPEVITQYIFDRLCSKFNQGIFSSAIEICLRFMIQFIMLFL